jgi:hypothetical protein
MCAKYGGRESTITDSGEGGGGRGRACDRDLGKADEQDFFHLNNFSYRAVCLPHGSTGHV